LRIKIETLSALDVITSGPNSLDSRLPRSNRWPVGALSAAEIAPFELKEISKGVGTFGFHASSGTAPLERYRSCVEPIVNPGPVPANLNVQVGKYRDENFVTATSLLPPTTTSPPRSNEAVVLFQMRLPLLMELRTAETIFRSFETLTITPSTKPASFLPAIVSLLEPTRVKVPSVFRETDSIVVETEPT
jgi:hypothetical protein